MRKLFFASVVFMTLLTGCAVNEAPTDNTASDNMALIEAQSDTGEASGGSSASAREDSAPTVETTHTPNATDTAFTTWSEIEQLTLEEALSESDCVVRAKYEAMEEFDDFAEYRFRLVDTYKGNADDELRIRWDKDFSDDFEPVFGEGEYILPLLYINSVYFEYPFYNVTGHVIIPCDTEGGIKSVSIGDITASAPSGLSTAENVAALAANVEDTSDIFFEDYVHSDIPEEIAEGSEYIVKALVNDNPSRTGDDRGIYNCDIVERYKGDVPDSIRVLLFYDSVEEGGEYYLFLSKNEKSVYYTISSKNSVYSADNAEIAKIAAAVCGSENIS